MTYSAGTGQETLLILHGGPGVPSDYMRESHFEFYVKKGLRVVTWDQLGCGESDQPDDDALWELPRFVEEVEHVRRKLNLKAVHLLGQSWGGVLGLEYCLAYPEWVKSFISANNSFNIPLMQRGFERHKMALGAETCRMMARREAEGTTDHPEYYGAYTLLAHRHICRAEVWPESLVFSMANIAKPVLSKVFGNYLFNCTGLLRNYDRTEELKKVNTPILVIHGEYDYIVVECAIHARDNLINAELVVLHDCSHDPFFEKPELYHQAVWHFLQNIKLITVKI
ncbi:proline iminopeptidase-family hydrolase [Piscirickettsia salmonis]|nr:proline iminopeptidase-family hydrolase [Piscirickettsia salmonis]QHS30397.1 proline iminopeptidase-family hydrolase [Piscirickettsia salmonis]